MAVDRHTRWDLLHDITFNRKTGTLVLQLGQQYVSWVLQEGNLTWISSTHPEYTMTQFLMQNRILEPAVLLAARSGITDSRSLGAVLFREGAADTRLLREWTIGYAAWLSPILLQRSTHIYWADRLPAPKTDFVHLPGVPLSRILMMSERESLEARSAFEFCEQFPDNYRVLDPNSLGAQLAGIERRLVAYLKRRDGLRLMYADPELDRLTCCRTLLILWIAGRLYPAPPHEPFPEAPATRWIERTRSIPPDWVIPLAVGMLLGILLSPSSARQEPPQPVARPLNQILKAPAWQAPSK